METIDSNESLRNRVAAWHRQEERIAFVPTMGNLHQGHLELVRRASESAQHVVVSIFVNPLQFGLNEDFIAYPRTLAADQEQLVALNVDILFNPSEEELYPDGQTTQTRVEVPSLSSILCGTSRQGHFSGVSTIVCKLFNLVQPNVAMFGEKDYQQLLIIKRMVRDLNLAIEIVGVPTVRDTDGLAMSSRNNYLSPAERAKAPILYQAIQEGAQGLMHGFAPLRAETTVYNALRSAGFRPDYVKIRRTIDLGEPTKDDVDLIILAAAYLGRTRLIDNLRVPNVPLA
ncbi:pantoate--beta-alanine ligase [Achromatium sp. WMS2]|nr:pantoate--beta-alanine ligase [Achromatium sp. WMS2]